jgi:integrase
MLIAQGAHPRAIMERMGHSTITVTLDNYGHLFPKLDEALDHALDSMYRDSRPISRARVARVGGEGAVHSP